MTICTNIAFEGDMDTLVLTFRIGRKTEQMRWTLPPTKVLERDNEFNATKTDGPFKNGKLRSYLCYKYIAEAMEHYYGPDAENDAERVKLWVDRAEYFPARIKGNDTLFSRAVEDIRDWAVRLLEFNDDSHALDAFLLRRSLVRTFNSFASGRTTDDSVIIDSPDTD